MRMDEKFIEERLKHERSESLMFDKILVLEQQLRTATEQLQEAEDEIEQLQEVGTTEIIEHQKELDKLTKQLSIAKDALNDLRMFEITNQALAKIEEVK